LSAVGGTAHFIKGAPGHWNRSRLGALFPFRCRNGSNPATSLTAVRRTSRPWSTSYDTALPMLRSRSVTGWPHHLIPQISCAPAVQRDLQNHSGPGRHRGNLRCSPLGDVARQGRHLLCKQSHAGALPAISSAAHGSIFHWELPRLADCKSAVKKPVGRRPVEHYHQLPPFYHTHAMGSEAEVVEAHGCQPCH
jgi:hypothetical protein